MKFKQNVILNSLLNKNISLSSAASEKKKTLGVAEIHGG